MEQLLDGLKQAPARTLTPAIAIPDMVREWKGMGDNMLKSLVDYVSDLESREQKLIVVTESLEKRLKDLEEKEVNFELFQEGKKRVLDFRERLLKPMCEEEVQLREKKLDEQLKLVHEHIESLELAQTEVHNLRLMEREKLKEIEKREKKIDSMAWSLEKRLREVEQREKEFKLFQDEKSRALVAKEELLDGERDDFVREVRFANEKLRERDELCCAINERLDSSLNLLEGMKMMIDEKFKEIKSWESVAHKSLLLILSEADLIRESLEKRFTECEEMEKEFNMLQEERIQKMEHKEQKLNKKRAKLLKRYKLRDEKLTERFKEIESRETLALKNLNGSLNEAHSIGESLEKRFKEVEEIEIEYNSVQKDKMKKLESKRTQLLEMVKLKNEKFTEIQLGHQTLESLEEMLSKKLKAIERREVSLNVACEELATREKDVDLSRESANIRLQELEKREKEFQLYRARKIRELELAEEKLRLTVKEFLDEIMLREEKFDMQDKMMHALLGRLDLAQNSVKDMNTLVGRRFKEIGCKEIELNYTKDWIERKMNELEVKAKAMKEQDDTATSEEKELEWKTKKVNMKERSLESWGKDHECNGSHLKDVMKNLELNKPDQPGECSVEQPVCSPREIELKGKQNDVLKECGFKQPQSADDLDNRSRVESDHLKLSIQTGEKTLEMLINDIEKDMELIGAEVFKVLLRSSDPAKLVLDAIERCYLSRLDKGDNVSRKIILVLYHLTKMSPMIHPFVREAATKLSFAWKSKMSVAETSLEVLGFLHFLAAYNLASCFGKDGLLSLLKIVAQHKETPELCRILGLLEYMPGFIQNLINEKLYLLASTYIHECGLNNMFPQSAVLNYYVQHLKVKRRTSSVAKDQAFASEIGELRLAVEHIIKNGLESEYSPDIIKARIKQLQINRANLRMRSGTPVSTNVWKRKENKRFAQTQVNRFSPRVGFHEPVLQHDRETKSSQVKKLVNEVPKTQPSNTSKRRKLLIR